MPTNQHDLLRAALSAVADVAMSAAAVHMRMVRCTVNSASGRGSSLNTCSELVHVHLKFVETLVELVVVGWLVDVSWWIAQLISRQTCHFSLPMQVAFHCHICHMHVLVCTGPCRSSRQIRLAAA